MLKSYLWKCTMPSLIWCLKSEALYCSFSCFLICISKVNTVKSLSEALLFAHRDNMLSSKIVLNVRKNFCAQHVLPRFELGIFMYWICNSMNRENILCTKIVLNVRKNFCTRHVLPRFELEIFMYSMNNLLLYCWCKNKSFWQRFTCKENQRE